MVVLKRLSVYFVALLLMIPIIPFNKPFSHPFWFAPVSTSIQFLLLNIWIVPAIIYAIVSCFVKKSIVKELLSESANAKDTMKAFIVSFFTYPIGILIVSYALALFVDVQIGQYSAPNLVYFSVYLGLVQNIFFRSPGYYFLKLRIISESLVLQFKVLLLNFFKILPVYLLLLAFKYNSDSSAIHTFVFISMLLVVIDYATRIFYYDTISILEKILGLRVYSEKKKDIKLMKIKR